jgi:hypothetical protein
MLAPLIPEPANQAVAGEVLIGAAEQLLVRSTIASNAESAERGNLTLTRSTERAAIIS